jgi:hypothetical protein
MCAGSGLWSCSHALGAVAGSLSLWVRCLMPGRGLQQYCRCLTHTPVAGTHGAMKAVFDGPVQQREVACMALYKRAYPKWPIDNDLSFAHN